MELASRSFSTTAPVACSTAMALPAPVPWGLVSVTSLLMTLTSAPSVWMP